MSVEWYREWPFIMFFFFFFFGGGSPLIRINKRKNETESGVCDTVQINGLLGFTKTPYERPFPIQFYPHWSKNQAKLENACFSRNGHRIKITQPTSMIMISFSFAEDALTKNLTLLARKVLKIRRSDFFGHPVYAPIYLIMFVYPMYC